MKISLAASLAGLTCLLLGCIAAPLPVPNPLLGIETSKRVSTSHAIKNHDKLMKKTKAFIDSLGVKKLHSIAEARKMRGNDRPIYHTWPIEIPSKYSNKAYVDSVNDLESYQKVWKKAHRKVIRHVEALSRDNLGQEKKDRAQEANQMLHGLTTAGSWLDTHFQDEGAVKKIEEIIKNPARNPSYVVQQKTKDLDKLKNAVNGHLTSLPNVKM